MKFDQVIGTKDAGLFARRLQRGGRDFGRDLLRRRPYGLLPVEVAKVKEEEQGHK